MKYSQLSEKNDYLLHVGHNEYEPVTLGSIIQGFYYVITANGPKTVLRSELLDNKVITVGKYIAFQTQMLETHGTGEMSRSTEVCIAQDNWIRRKFDLTLEEFSQAFEYARFLDKTFSTITA